MQIKWHIGEVAVVPVKNNDTYTVKDNTLLNDLVLSSTQLFAGKETRGHRHTGQEEIYFFIKGNGLMIVGEETDEPFAVVQGDVILIPDGAFHKVLNPSNDDLVFNCVFNGKRAKEDLVSMG
jgi:oxalate decarboxylase/phosphoglucose isomerase-like protein (cupin superfamily)